MAIKGFKNQGSEDIHNGLKSKRALMLLPVTLHHKCKVKFARLGAATSLDDLRSLRGNRLETLKGKRKGQYSIRLNDQYRICFQWKDKNAYNVEVIDYH